MNSKLPVVTMLCPKWMHSYQKIINRFIRRSALKLKQPGQKFHSCAAYLYGKHSRKTRVNSPISCVTISVESASKGQVYIRFKPSPARKISAINLNS